jgi:hypothetical protein
VVRSQWSVAKRQKSEVRDQRTEDRRQTTEDRISKLGTRPEGGSPKDNFEIEKSRAGQPA